MVADLDQPAVDPAEELRVIPLQHIDAQETLEIMSEYLRKPAGTSGRRGSGSDLIGDIRLQASATLNALVVSGSQEEINRVEKIVLDMDKEVEGAGVPKIIPLDHTTAAALAVTLTQIFTEPAQKTSKARTSPETIPLIMADETTNSLVVRARANDFRLIEDMARELDKEMVGTGGLEVIQVPRGVDVVDLARQIESTVNKGEQAKQRIQKGYIPRQVAIGADERSSAMIVAGSPDMFPIVRKLVEDLQTLEPPTGGRRALVIPVKTKSARDIEQVLNQYIEQQTGRRRR
jgi:hypothetical protein